MDTKEIDDKKRSTQLLQRFSSEILWHFPGRGKKDEETFEILFSILKEGLQIGNKNEKVIVTDPSIKAQKTFYGYPVCCLADIPLKDLHLHAWRYGNYAIGFHKESASKKGFNPVLYLNQSSILFFRLLNAIEKIQNSLEEGSSLSKDFEEISYIFWSHVKSGILWGNLEKNDIFDERQLNNFYYEREWRSTFNWEFTHQDVAIIIVPNTKLSQTVERIRENKENLRVNKVIPIIPFDMIYLL